MKKILPFMFVAFMAQAQAAQWFSEQNQISFLSTKITQQKLSITEQSQLPVSQATLNADGNFEMSIDLAAVKTNIDLRDQRLRDWVFKTSEFAKATISGKIENMPTIEALPVGGLHTFSQPLTLNVVGKSVPITAELQVFHTHEGTLFVSTRTPILLDINQMEMQNGVEEMVKVMSLSSIAAQVPVSFSGNFSRQP